MGPAGAVCRTCGTELRHGARFCDGCGARAAEPGEAAEFKQVTVLFGDVVGSMAIASAMGPERLREMMTDVFHRAAMITRRYGGTVDKFTGDGIMALFGAPVSLEDHALRACLAALDIQTETRGLAGEVERRDGVALQLRVGLNSGLVIAGEIGSGPEGYTAVGEQVGMAQRMESVAPPGGVMLSESTARLVEHTVVLGEPEMVDIKGADAPVAVRRLLGTTERGRLGRHESTLVGRKWELNALTGVLDESIAGSGCVVYVVGPPGIGKSRIGRELATLADSRGVKVFSTFCESHASEIQFHVVARLLRAAFDVEDLDAAVVRAQVRAQIPDADPDDLLLLNDLLAIADPEVATPDIDPDARRRRLVRLINSASLARATPAVYVIEDVHWIDDVSESMLAEFLSVIPRTCSMVLVTYRPEYVGALRRTPNSQTISLAPLDDPQSAALVAELLGSHSSVAAAAAQIAQRAAGNPFFVEEIVRDLAERGFLNGDRGNYVRIANIAEIDVPATLQATIAARIDRLAPRAKRTLNAAAVIGSRFDADLLAKLMGDTALVELLEAELIDQVMFTPCAEYVFRHPLIRTVAYESQLKSGRAELHRRLAAEIEQGDPAADDENAALIAGHLEAACDLRAAFSWYMRAGTWSTNRDIVAARVNWQRASQVADKLPADDQDRVSMRIAPCALLCGSAFRVGGSGADTGFDVLRDLCTAAGDQVSLAIGMSGTLVMLGLQNRHFESSRLASECTTLVESIGDPTLTVGLSYGSINAKHEAGEVAEVLRLAQRVIDLADGDPTKGDLFIGSPLALAIAMRGLARMCMGIPGWRDDFDNAVVMARAFDPSTRSFANLYKYVFAIANGAVLPDAAALRDTAEALQIAEQSGNDFTLAAARLARGLTLVHRVGPQREVGFDLLAKARETALQERFSMTAVPVIDIEIAKEKARTGDVDGAIELSRAVIDDMFGNGEMIWHGPAITVLVESLLRRGANGDLQDAQSAIDRLAAVPTDPGFVLHELPLLRLRALLARARGDGDSHRTFMARYRSEAATAGFEALGATHL